MLRNLLAYLFVAALIGAVFSSMAEAQELQDQGRFYVAFSALNDKGVREHFVLPLDIDFPAQCQIGVAPMMRATKWMVEHPSYSDMRDVHCARPSEADL